jgi:D-beta-D-heptose 7-phosphate kinase/D-beta-D-heptose 1-phosphate adenosyltransferase
VAVPVLLERFGRPRSNTLVFTNGVFDLMHRGHVDYLFAARALGDTLVVGLNTDASVRRLKGKSRPVMAQDDRAFVLAGLACVDAVTLFDDDTPARLIGRLLPDVLVKGGDYRMDQVAGRAEVEGAGGRVVLIPLTEGCSTTDVIERIREAS